MKLFGSDVRNKKMRKTSAENENGVPKRCKMKVPVVLSGSLLVSLRVLTGRKAIAAEHQRLLLGGEDGGGGRGGDEGT